MKRRTLRELRVGFRDDFWTLVIPAGIVVDVMDGTKGTVIGPRGVELGVIARPEWIEGVDAARAAAKPHSLFSHDATYYYVWIPESEFEESA